jgi:hypothetical protein
LATLIGVSSSAISFISNGNIDEVERIMKQDWNESALEPLDTLEFNRLIMDQNATSID